LGRRHAWKGRRRTAECNGGSYRLTA
jgi:hypothetical protein